MEKGFLKLTSISLVKNKAFSFYYSLENQSIPKTG